VTSLALSQTVISSDVVGSSGVRHRQSYLDRVHDAVLDQAFDAVRRMGHPMASAFRRVDGDSATTVINADVSRSWVLSDFVLREVFLALADVNRAANEEYRLRLRMAVDFGEVVLDPPHVEGDAVVRAARLRDAPALREAMSTNRGASLGLIISDRFYGEVVSHGERGLDPAAFQAAEVTVKDFSERGWVHLPGVVAQPVPPPATSPTASTPDRPVIRAEVVNKFEERVDARHAVFGVVHDRRR
jgi:hypothetical protein